MVIDNHYKLLGIKPGASTSEIKKAFRKKAKQLHPDIAGEEKSEAMQKLLLAYHTLSNSEHRFAADMVKAKKSDFNYKKWLIEQGDSRSMAKLVFYDLIRLEEDNAIDTWRQNGGLDFSLQNHMERSDWMDCQYILAEELDKRGFSYEAFKLITALLIEEQRRPYFYLFTPEIYSYLKTIVTKRLKADITAKFPVQEGLQIWIDCLEALIGIGFSVHDENKFKKSISITLKEIRT